ncbi:ATP-binding protein [Candidatus Woesearchaeota archaeon]|nr:ATP-binding protein [Candidatus Woesearchaeota archaeon]
MIDDHNPHWEEDFFYNHFLYRNLYSELVKELTSKQIISLIGLRRTGKTTLFYQLINHLIKDKQVQRKHILYFSFDEEQPKLSDVINSYELKMGKSIRTIQDKLYIFLDEIQKLKNWQNQIKYYYDFYPNLKFFVSGSASLFIKKHTQESLAGRIYEYTLSPLTFKEFLTLKGRGELIDKQQLLSEEIKREFQRYQKRQFIEMMNEDEEKMLKYTKSIIEQIIYHDIPSIFPIEQEELLLKLLKIVASQPGMFSGYESLSREFGVHRETLSNYFFYLEESFLTRKLYNYSKNAFTSEKKLKRIYLITPAFFSYLNPQIEESKLIENLIISHLNAKWFWRTPSKEEVDIILEKGSELIPVEVKYANIIVKKDFKNLLKFSRRFKIKEAIMVTKDTEGKEILQTGKDKIHVQLIPAWKFCLNYSEK